MDQAMKLHDHFAGGTLVGLSKTAFRPRTKKRDFWEDKCGHQFQPERDSMGQTQYFKMMNALEIARLNKGTSFPEFVTSDESAKIKGYGGKE